MTEPSAATPNPSAVPAGEQSDTLAPTGYDFDAMQAKWLPVWEELNVFGVDQEAASAAPVEQRRMMLDMFPYPSGDLHMGHAEAFAIGDVVARYWNQRGYHVLHPIGWDSFGLPAENAAIKRDEHPAKWTYANIETQKQSFKRYAISFDWASELHTSDPEYYKWTQWLFLKFRERGLAYRKASFVNWCPVDQTVLANEQVINGACERCESPVTKRQLTQWYFKITDYAQRLLDDMEPLEDTWPSRVLTMQRNWIGRSEGAFVNFFVDTQPHAPVRVFTTRPDTLFGATFMVVAPESSLAPQLVTDEHRAEFEAYVEKVKSASEIDRLSTERAKTGVFTGSYATNPVTGQQMPVWVADYVLADYGTGVIMAVPGGDQRDYEFAQVYDLPIIYTVQPPEGHGDEAYTGDGAVINSANDDLDLNGMTVEDAKAAMIEYLDRNVLGEKTVNFRLRDWLLSRQRFWGAPIPVIHCEACGEVPVPEDQLPVRLPDDVSGADLKPKGSSPLAALESWVNVDCPKCGAPAKRDTDTMDTFVDSSWYYLRYASPNRDDVVFDDESVRRWLPAKQYVGGVEHAILHLLYSRFFTKVLYDMGMIAFQEPFSALLNQGQVINQGKAMSKSLGNGVDLGEQIAKYGVDAVRLTVVFAGPPADDIDWADMSPGGSLRFLQRAWRLAGDVTSQPGVDPSTGDEAVRKTTHRIISEVTELLEMQRLNVAVARVMELVNHVRKAIDSGPGGADPAVREGVEATAIMLSLFAPYTAEEMWSELGHQPSVAKAGWPVAEEKLLVQDEVTCIVQVAGKVRARLQVSPNVSDAELESLALAQPAVQAALDGQEVRKMIVRAPKLVNVVPAK